MQHADRRPLMQRRPQQPSRSPLSRALLALLTLLAATSPHGAWAQPATPVSAAPAGSPTDLFYTPVNGPAAVLYPRLPGEDAQPGRVFNSERNGVAYAANAAVGRLQVEVDRNAVPADGQSPVKLKVLVLGHDGQPLRQTVYLTLEHSAGRLLLPGGRTDEFGPRGLDADRATPGVQLKVEGGQAEFTLLAPTQAQDVRVRVSAAARAQNSRRRPPPGCRRRPARAHPGPGWVPAA